MRGLLRSIWDEPRPGGALRRVWRDWLLVAVIVPAAVVEGLLRPDLPGRVLTVGVAVMLAPTVLWRRTRPLQMVAIAFVVCFLIEVVTQRELQLNALVFMLLLPYSLLRWGSGREAVLGIVIVLAKIGQSAVMGHLTLSDAAGGGTVVFTAMALGAALRFRSRARMRELDQVKLLERERLARDLHDTVAHHVSAMAIRAQAGLATLESNPDAAAEALRLIEAEASRALAEMRTMVRALRGNEPPELAPNPGIADLARLAARTGTEPAVEVKVTGDVDDLPPSLGTAVYRLAQESVTNALRHARHATRVEVRVTADESSVRLTVTDDGEPGAVGGSKGGSKGGSVRHGLPGHGLPEHGPLGHGPLEHGPLEHGLPEHGPLGHGPLGHGPLGHGPLGHGLLGMAERAQLLGGSCEAGPNPGRGWTVSAVLPRQGAAARQEAP